MHFRKPAEMKQGEMVLLCANSPSVLLQMSTQKLSKCWFLYLSLFIEL